ncbi:MAG: hypothetical protein Q4F27_04640, partial [Desulfovibrionaceae bacterium]|nr:hypothetical protein [Desulfovibrionaceae bacterium]
MKNLKMALKIGLGFGLVVAVMCVLSLLAIKSMNEQETNATAISDTYMPELVIGVHIDRGASDALASMLRYGMLEEMKYADEARVHLKTIRDEVAAADALVDKYPELVKLRANLDKLRPVLKAYSDQVEKTVDLTEKLKHRRMELIEIGQGFMDLVTNMLAEQNKRIDATVDNDGGVAEVHRRLDQSRALNKLLDLCAAVRMSNFQSQV